MIIGFEAKRVFQNFSGLGNYSRNTINLLNKFYPENQYKLFAPKLTNLFVLPPSTEVITPVSFLWKYFRSYWRLHKCSKLLKCNKIDIFHGLSHVLPSGIKKTGIPSVLTIHDLIFMRFPEYFKKLDRKMYESITRNSCNRANKIIAISNQTKADLVSYFNIDPQKIEVVYQSCNSLFYDRVTEDEKSLIRLKYNLPNEFILNVGTIERRKNQLSILQGIFNEKIATPVVFIGKATEYINDLYQFILKSGLQKQVIFLHHTTDNELRTIYQMAKVMIYPSFFEGFGLPVLEAQASGCPVITSNISSLPEAGGEGALYVNPRDISEIGKVISRTLSDNQLREELIKKGAENAELFSDKLVAERLVRLYKSLLQAI